MSRVTKIRKTKDGRYEGLFLYGGNWVRLGWWWERNDAKEALVSQEDGIRVIARGEDA